MIEERLMGIDFGEKRIGIAVTDPLNMFAYPLVTLPRNPNFWHGLRSLISQYSVVRIILGYPLKEDGGISFITKNVLEFKGELESKTGLKVELVDERYSSSIAKQRIIESVASKKKRRDKSLLDKNAACIILEDYLNTVQNKSG